MISRGCLRAIVALGLATASVALASPALAQVTDLPTYRPGGGGQKVDTSELGDSGDTSTRSTLSQRSVKLFDSRRSTVSYGFDLGPLWSRKVQETTPAGDRTNFEHAAPLAGEVSFGTVHTTPMRPFYLVGNMKTLFRVVDSKSFSWAIYHQELGGGVVLGPIELETRLRLGILTADIMHAEPSVQLFTPGVSAGFGIRLGALRIDFRGNADYLWRWFGPDYALRSITVGLRLDTPKMESPLRQD